MATPAWTQGVNPGDRVQDRNNLRRFGTVQVLLAEEERLLVAFDDGWAEKRRGDSLSLASSPAQIIRVEPPRPTPAEFLALVDDYGNKMKELGAIRPAAGTPFAHFAAKIQREANEIRDEIIHLLGGDPE